MGQSKINKSIKAALPPLNEGVLRRVSIAIQKLFTSSSDQFGADCFTHAGIAKEVLKRLGYETTLVIGESGWRVGDGDSDVILHAKMPNIDYAENSFPYHAWLEYGDYILDFTTYQLTKKAKDLDEMDGGNTVVKWCPDYLFIKKSETMSLKDMVNHETSGKSFYLKSDLIKNKVQAFIYEFEEYHISAAMMIYENPELNVIGPRNI